MYLYYSYSGIVAKMTLHGSAEYSINPKHLYRPLWENKTLEGITINLK